VLQKRSMSWINAAGQMADQASVLFVGANGMSQGRWLGASEWHGFVGELCQLVGGDLSLCECRNLCSGYLLIYA